MVSAFELFKIVHGEGLLETPMEGRLIWVLHRLHKNCRRVFNMRSGPTARG